MTRFRAAFIGLTLGFGCTPSADGPHRPLPAYAGHAIELFDDTIEPGAVGLTLDGVLDPKADRGLRERTQVGDAVVRVRATTITSKQEDNGVRYVVGLRTLETIAGQFPPGETFELWVGPTTPAAGILKPMEQQVVGKSLIVFVRAFVRSDGDQELHFHIGPDTKDEINAVRDAAALAGLSATPLAKKPPGP
jgi:hypothetical protein